MVEIESHKTLMSNSQQLAKHLGPFVSLRGEHLKKLHPIELAIRAKSPFQATFDVSRSQPPAYNEITYTEMLGGMFVSPQSTEASARQVKAAYEDETDYGTDMVSLIMTSRDNLDKYNLKSTGEPSKFKKVAFPPGSNIFSKAISRESLGRAMEDPELMIKLHPMTNDETKRMLGISFGYQRLLDSGMSGWEMLLGAEEVWTSTTSEMGLYAILLGDKNIHNISAYPYEQIGAYYPFYRMLWNEDSIEAKRKLTRILNSPFSGFFHPDDPEWESKLDIYFAKMVEIRSEIKPIVTEINAHEWAAAIANRVNQGQEAQNVLRKS